MTAPGFRVVIPARYASTRLPGKPLLELAGRPMLQHVYDHALQSGASEVLIATDDERIRAAAEKFGARVCMTDPGHQSGTDRLGEVVQHYGWPGQTIVVNVQGDEPLLPSGYIAQVARELASHPAAEVATLACPCEQATDLQNPNKVKLVRDKNGFALYFSRAPIPFRRDAQGGGGQHALCHIGLYAYRAAFLEKYRQLEPSPLEQEEKLEQLRVLWHGMKIYAGLVPEMPGPGVDTREDLMRVASVLARGLHQ